MGGHLIIFLFCALIAAVSAQACPCDDPNLCKPITTAPRPEMFVFQLTEDDWLHYDWSLVTTMASFGAWDPNMICVAHKAGARVVLAGGFPLDQIYNLSATSAWMIETVEKLKSTLADGINLDIEDPLDAADAPQLTLLIANFTSYVKEQLPYAQITFDYAWSPNCIDGRCYDFKAISEIVDFAVMMDYDERSQIFGPCIASANSPPALLAAGTKNFTDLGIPAWKLVMGVPWYGYNYPCEDLTDDVCTIKEVPFRGVNCSDAAGREYDYSTLLVTAAQAQAEIHWDDTLESPWFNFYDNSTNQWHQVWFDNHDSITIKAKWGRDHGLRGMSMWTGDFIDYTNNTQWQDMWGAMRTFFH